MTDALHNVQATHTNGSGKTLKTIQKSGPDGEITTSFEYDGIQRLVRVTDTEGNVTTSTYDTKAIPKLILILAKNTAK